MTPALSIYTPSPIAQLDITPTLILPEDYFEALKWEITATFNMVERAFDADRAEGKPTNCGSAAEKFLSECRVSRPVLQAILTGRAEELALWDIVRAGAAFGMAPAHVDLDECGQPIVWYNGDDWDTPISSPLLAQMNARKPVDRDGKPMSIERPCIVIPQEFWEMLRETIRNDQNAIEERKRYYQPEKGPLYAWNTKCPRRNQYYSLTLFVQGKQKLSAQAALCLAEHYNLRFDLLTCGPNGARTQMLGVEKPQAVPSLRLVGTKAEEMNLNEQQFEAMLDLSCDIANVEDGVAQIVTALRAISGPAGEHLTDHEKQIITQLAADHGEGLLAYELPRMTGAGDVINRKLDEYAKKKYRSGFTIIE